MRIKTQLSRVIICIAVFVGFCCLLSAGTIRADTDLGAGLFTEPARSTKTEEYGYRKETYAYKKVDGLEIFADVILPAKDEVRAVVLCIHGGGFMFGSRTSWPGKPLLDKLI